MIGTLAAALAIGAAGAEDTVAEAKIIAASLFKNGYAVVTRQIDLKGGQALIESAPRSSLGTFWLVGIDGTELGSVVNTQVMTKVDKPLSSLDEVLTNNVGKMVKLAIVADDQNLGRTRTGKILSATGQVVILKSETATDVIPKTAIQSVSSPDGDLKWNVPSETSKRVLKITSKNGKDGKVVLVSLERGILWAPSYMVDITNPKKLKVLCKATIVNDLGELKSIEAKLITGFPNVPYAPFEEPITANMNLDQFVSTLMQAGAPAAAKMSLGQMMSQNSLEAGRGLNFDQAFPTQPELPGMQLEDLFFYRLPKVELKKGDRGMYYLFGAESDYEHLYTWDIANTNPEQNDTLRLADEPGDVWNCLKFKNNSGQPWTTGPATTMQDGQVLGQDMMHYTGTGSEALVKITKALDVRADISEEELTRERGAIKNSSGNPVYDLVTIKGTLQVKNRKSSDIKLRIKKELTGEVVSKTGDATTMKLAKGLRDINPRTQLTWTPKLGSGKDLELVYTYKIYVSSRY